MSVSFNPKRLEIARQRRGMTIADLANAVRITVKSLHNYRTYRRVPERDTIEQFAEVLDFPVAFFYGLRIDLPPEGGTSYRKLSRTSARSRMQARAIGAIGLRLADWITSTFDLPPPDIPLYGGIDDPEVAAAAVRASWGLGELSITNMVTLLEIHGAHVFSLVIDTPTLDAFSFWRGATPYVFVDTSKSAERTRMDVAHELGHLVMHSQGGVSQGRLAEYEARSFAGAFLMPKDSVVAHSPFGYLDSLDQLLESKKHWNVSAVSLIVRMNELGYFTSYRYRTLMAEASRRGYQTTEPDECAPDFSVVLDKLFSPYREGTESVSAVARAINVHSNEVYNLMLGLVPFPMPVA